MPVDCQVSEESLDLAFSHVLRMTFIMEEDKAPDPADIRLFGTDGITFLFTFMKLLMQAIS